MIRINLLPGAAKRRKRQELIKLLSIAFSIFGVAVIGFGVVIALVFSQNLALKSQIKKIDAEIGDQESKIAAFSPVIEKSKVLKSKLVTINELLAQYNKWADFLLDFANAVPSEGVKFISLSIAEDNNMQVSGIADSTVYLARLLLVLDNANSSTTYYIKAGDTVAKIAKFYNTTPDAIYKLNNATTEAELLALEAIIVPKPFFDSVEVVSISPQGEDDVDKEIERNVNFSLAIVVSAGSF